MPLASALTDAELHGLVDGQLDPDRRTEVLRRAAASPRDRALIEAWQDQADAIRAAFGGVDCEQVPAALDLRTSTVLHIPHHARPAAAKTPPKWRFRWLGTAATLAVMVAGLAGSWIIAGLPVDPAAHDAEARTASDDEKAVAARTNAALAFGDGDTAAVTAPAEPPALAAIPDLSAAGYTFTGAEARGVAPRATVFRYRNAAGERVALGAVKGRSGGDDAGPVPRDGGLTWRSGSLTYAIYGTVAQDRLRDLAATIGGR